MTEFERIKKHFASLVKEIEGSLNLEDDGAVISLGGENLMVITSDTCIEDLHFPKNIPADIIARRTLRMTLSNLAAMGACPLGYTHTLILPKRMSDDWVETYVHGLQMDQDFFDFPLLKNDLVAPSLSPLSISITGFGFVHKDFALTRAKTLAGDRVFVTGPLGDALMGLKINQGQYADLPQSSKDYFLERFHLPTPRMREAIYLKSYINGATDISDGLIKDLDNICRSSQTQAFVDASKVPLSTPMRDFLESLPQTKKNALLQDILSSSNDYELLLTLSPDRCEDARFSAVGQGIALHQIGHMGFFSPNDPKVNRVMVSTEEGSQ